jgi:hypothetical protein
MELSPADLVQINTSTEYWRDVVGSEYPYPVNFEKDIVTARRFGTDFWYILSAIETVAQMLQKVAPEGDPTAAWREVYGDVLDIGLEFEF